MSTTETTDQQLRQRPLYLVIAMLCLFVCSIAALLAAFRINWQACAMLVAAVVLFVCSMAVDEYEPEKS